MLLNDLERRTQERDYLARLIAVATGGGCFDCPFNGNCPTIADGICSDPGYWIEAARKAVEEEKACLK